MHFGGWHGRIHISCFQQVEPYQKAHRQVFRDLACEFSVLHWELLIEGKLTKIAVHALLHHPVKGWVVNDPMLYSDQCERADKPLCRGIGGILLTLLHRINLAFQFTDIFDLGIYPGKQIVSGFLFGHMGLGLIWVVYG